MVRMSTTAVEASAAGLMDLTVRRLLERPWSGVNNDSTARWDWRLTIQPDHRQTEGTAQGGMRMRTFTTSMRVPLVVKTSFKCPPGTMSKEREVLGQYQHHRVASCGTPQPLHPTLNPNNLKPLLKRRAPEAVELRATAFRLTEDRIQELLLPPGAGTPAGRALTFPAPKTVSCLLPAAARRW